MKKKYKNIIEYSAFRVFIFIFKLLPYKMSLWKLKKIFLFGGYTLGFRKKVGMDNLNLVYPDKSELEKKKILKQMYVAMGATAAESFIQKDEDFLNRVSCVGMEKMQEAYDMGKGVILASAHLGNFEMAGRYLSRNNFQTSVVAKKQRNGLFHEYTMIDRRKYNIEIIGMKLAVRTILKLLRKNYIVGIMMDQNAGRKGILTNFMGHPASTFAGTARIAMKTGCPVIVGVPIRQPDESQIFYFEGPYFASDYSDDLEGQVAFTQFISTKLEKYIHQYPEQWFWVHRRWRGEKKAKTALKSFTS